MLQSSEFTGTFFYFYVNHTNSWWYVFSPFLVLYEISVTSRSYAELSGRTQCVVGDVVVSLVNLGISLQGITTFGKREGRPTLPNPQQMSQTKQLSLLQAGTKLSHPPHIPHHLPVLPDPHAYIRTPVSCKHSHVCFVICLIIVLLFQTHKQPVTEYEAIREKAANQKRDIEKALTKFLAKTSETYNLFSSEDASNQMFPCKSNILFFFFLFLFRLVLVLSSIEIVIVWWPTQKASFTSVTLFQFA